MQNTLVKRLALLETAKATRRLGEDSIHDIQRLMIVLISCHLGEMQERDSIAEATSRALDYGRSQDLVVGLEAEGGSSTCLVFEERYQSAAERLLALRGTGLGDSGNGVACFQRSLFDAMPKCLQRYRFLDRFDSAVTFEGIPEDAMFGLASSEPMGGDAA